MHPNNYLSFPMSHPLVLATKEKAFKEMWEPVGDYDTEATQRVKIASIWIETLFRYASVEDPDGGVAYRRCGFGMARS